MMIREMAAQHRKQPGKFREHVHARWQGAPIEKLKDELESIKRYYDELRALYLARAGIRALSTVKVFYQCRACGEALKAKGWRCCQEQDLWRVDCQTGQQAKVATVAGQRDLRTSPLEIQQQIRLTPHLRLLHEPWEASDKEGNRR